MSSDEKQIIEKIKGMSINKNIPFKHSIYGIVRRGGYKGKEVEIREYYPAKYEVMLDKRGYISISKIMKPGDKVMGCEVISEVERTGDVYKYLVSCKKTVLFLKKNIKIKGKRVSVIKGEMKGEIGELVNEQKAKLLINIESYGSNIMRFVDAEDVNYKDLLLKNGKYFSVTRVEGGKDNYKIYGEEIGGSSKVISMSDIKSFMPGMDIGNIKNVDNVIGDEREYISEEIDESEESKDEGDEEVEEDIYDDRKDKDMRASYKDIERTEWITQQLSPIQKGYYDMIKVILDINGESIENINAYEIVDTIEIIVTKLNNIIKRANINFDISGSKIDMKILVSLLVAYEMQRSELIFPGLKSYIKNLFDRNFFYSTLDELMVSFILRKDNNVFKCDIKELRGYYKRREYYNIIESVILCFNDTLRQILSVPFDLRLISVDKDVVPIEKVQRIEKDKKKFITIDDILKDNIIIDARRVLWNPEGETIVNSFKELLMKSSKNVEGEMKLEVDKKRLSILEDKRGLYKYVYDNLDKAPMVLNELFMKLEKVMLDRYIEFGIELRECIGKIMCRDKVTRKYLEMFFDKKGKVKKVSDEEYLNMKRYYELSRIFDRLISRINEKVKKPKEEMRKEKLMKKEMDIKELIKSRKRVLKKMEGVDELLEGIDDITLDSDMIGLKDKRRRM